jgi:hypothetical protein
MPQSIRKIVAQHRDALRKVEDRLAPVSNFGCDEPNHPVLNLAHNSRCVCMPASIAGRDSLFRRQLRVLVDGPANFAFEKQSRWETPGWPVREDNRACAAPTWHW